AESGRGEEPEQEEAEGERQRDAEEGTESPACREKPRGKCEPGKKEGGHEQVRAAAHREAEEDRARREVLNAQRVLGVGGQEEIAGSGEEEIPARDRDLVDERAAEDEGNDAGDAEHERRSRPHPPGRVREVVAEKTAQ